MLLYIHSLSLALSLLIFHSSHFFPFLPFFVFMTFQLFTMFSQLFVCISNITGSKSFEWIGALFFWFWFSIVCWAACMAIAPQCFTNNVKTNGIKHLSQDQGTEALFNPIHPSYIKLTRNFLCHRLFCSVLKGRNWPISRNRFSIFANNERSNC